MAANRTRRLWLLAIILASLLTRAIFLAQIVDTPDFKVPVLDAAWYDIHALEVLKGDLLASQALFRVPLYIYFLSLFYKIFGHSYLPPIAFQVILGSLTCGIVFLIAERAFGLVAGLIAGFGMAFYKMAVFSDVQLLPTTLFIFLIVLSTYLIMRGLDGHGSRNWILAGILIGLALLTRPDVVVFVLATCIAVLWIMGLRKAVSKLAYALLPLLVASAILGLRNFLVTGDFYLVSSQGAVNLYAGNSLVADGKTPITPPTLSPYDIWLDKKVDAMKAAAEQYAFEHVGKPLSDRELTEFFIKETLSDIGENPARWVRLLLRKVYYSFNNYERSDLKSIWRLARHHSWLMRKGLLSFVFVIPAASAGLILVFLRKHGFGILIAASAGGFVLNMIVFFVSWRYRLPAIPYLWTLAGYGAAQTIYCFGNRRWSLGGILLGSMIAVGFISVSSYLDVKVDQYASNYLVNEAAIYDQCNRYQEAIEILKEAVELDPADQRSYLALGIEYSKLGQIEEARKAMEIAAMLYPPYQPLAFHTIGVALYNMQDFASAAEEFKKAAQFDSFAISEGINIAICMINLGKKESADSVMTELAKRFESSREAMIAIADGWINLGSPDRAEEILENLIEKDPNDVEALLVMADALAIQGRTDQALDLLRRASVLSPRDTRVRDAIRALESGLRSPK